MARSLIPFPSTNHPNVPISRCWIAFRVIHKAGGPSWAVVDSSTYSLHAEASACLHYLLGSARSTNTIRAYAQRLAAYFTCLGSARLNWARACSFPVYPGTRGHSIARECTYDGGRTLPLTVGLLAGTALLASIGIAEWLELRRNLPGNWRWIPGTAAAWLVGLLIFLAVSIP